MFVEQTMVLKRASHKAMQHACRNYHYSKTMPAGAMGYSVFEEGQWCGVVMFGRGANKYIARPYNLVQGEVIELVRVALNGKQSSTSKAVSIALKLIKRDAPLAKLVVSYADLDQGHLGTIYQATNWIFEGVVSQGERNAFIIKGKKVHPKSVHAKGVRQNLRSVRRVLDPFAQVHTSRGKVKYLYPLTKQMRQQVKKLHKPYLKELPASEA